MRWKGWSVLAFACALFLALPAWAQVSWTVADDGTGGTVNRLQSGEVAYAVFAATGVSFILNVSPASVTQVSNPDDGLTATVQECNSTSDCTDAVDELTITDSPQQFTGSHLRINVTGGTGVVKVKGAQAGVGSSGGVSDHGALSGLADDDHAGHPWMQSGTTNPVHATPSSRPACSSNPEQVNRAQYYWTTTESFWLCTTSGASPAWTPLGLKSLNFWLSGVGSITNPNRCMPFEGAVSGTIQSCTVTNAWETWITSVNKTTYFHELSCSIGPVSTVNSTDAIDVGIQEAAGGSFATIGSIVEIFDNTMTDGDHAAVSLHLVSTITPPGGFGVRIQVTDADVSITNIELICTLTYI